MFGGGEVEGEGDEGREGEGVVNDEGGEGEGGRDEEDGGGIVIISRG